MPETMNFAEAMAHLLDGGSIAGPGLPTRNHIVNLARMTPDETPMVNLVCAGKWVKFWNPKPLDLVRDDWRVAEFAEVPPPEPPTSEQTAIQDLCQRVDVIEGRVEGIREWIRKTPSVSPIRDNY